ncbi:glycosyltransferase family 2 protein [Pseudobacteriovorax antillogorgiicola]|uniref:glycosyltransferase family 2 protein n=1 Tax=Pseudobacteriovorax antillogorgiicola TaxID=1513793 RepID=UPI001A9F64A2|nr:glycosyltransferase [Pseudobacteriovorax antillogorgiicola]
MSLVIPIYNEATTASKNIQIYLDSLHRNFQHFELIVVDDGSDDGTSKILEEFKNLESFTLLKNYANFNVGIALQRGFGASSCHYVCHTGIDMPVSVEDIRRKIEEHSGSDVIVLERSSYPGATRWRRFISGINRSMIKLLFPSLSSGISDFNFTQIYRHKIIKCIWPKSKSPSFTTPEMIMNAKLNGLVVSAIPCAYSRREEGKGSLGRFFDITWALYDMACFRMTTLASKRRKLTLEECHRGGA